jgi:hypothetical protein
VENDFRQPSEQNLPNAENDLHQPRDQGLKHDLHEPNGQDLPKVENDLYQPSSENDLRTELDGHDIRAPHVDEEALATLIAAHDPPVMYHDSSSEIPGDFEDNTPPENVSDGFHNADLSLGNTKTCTIELSSTKRIDDTQKVCRYTLDPPIWRIESFYVLMFYMCLIMFIMRICD